MERGGASRGKKIGGKGGTFIHEKKSHQVSHTTPRGDLGRRGVKIEEVGRGSLANAQGSRGESRLKERKRISSLPIKY